MIYWTVFLTAIASSGVHFFRQLKIIALPVFFALALVLLFINGFKYASVDYFGYLDLFNDTSFKDIKFPFYTTNYGTTGMEFIWASFSSLFKWMGLPFEAWVFFIAVLSMSIKFYFYTKYLKFPLIAFVAYLSLLFAIDLGQLRNGLAGAVLLFAIQPVLKRQFFRFLIVVFIAANIQVIAWVAFPLYFFFWQFKKRPKLMLLLFIALFLISASGGAASLLTSIAILPELVQLKLQAYSERGADARSTALSYVGIVYLLVFSCFYKNKIKILNNKPEVYVLGVFFTYGLMLSYFFTGIHTAAARSLDLLTLPAFIFIFAYLFEDFKRIENKLIILLLGFLFFVLNFYKVVSSESGFAPYQNILF